MQTVFVYGYVLDGIVSAIREVGISGSRSTSRFLVQLGVAQEGGQRQQPAFTGIVVNNFKFQIYRYCTTAILISYMSCTPT
jgi:hypothetical protein